MSDYEILMIILTTASLIISTLTYSHKKQPPCSLVKNRRLNLNLIFAPGRGAVPSLTGCLVKYIIASILKMSNKNRPLRQLRPATPLKEIHKKKSTMRPHLTLLNLSIIRTACYRLYYAYIVLNFMLSTTLPSEHITGNVVRVEFAMTLAEDGEMMLFKKMCIVMYQKTEQTR